jgi:cytochrome c-type biogenesis protein CcmH/NrfG
LRASARELVQMDPNGSYGYAMAGWAEEGTHQHGAAKINFQKAVRLGPNNGSNWYGLAEAELGAHDYQGAIDAFTRSIELSPKQWSAWSGRAAARQALGQDAAAFQDAQTACRNGLKFACRLAQEMHHPR